jgi:hypothetical protein
VVGWCFGGVAVEMRDGVMGDKLRARGVLLGLFGFVN